MEVLCYIWIVADPEIRAYILHGCRPREIPTGFARARPFGSPLSTRNAYLDLPVLILRVRREIPLFGEGKSLVMGH